LLVLELLVLQGALRSLLLLLVAHVSLTHAALALALIASIHLLVWN
jgi:hypothetical protein